MKPYRTDEFVHKLFYETSRFSAFNNQWVVKARINNSQRDPTQSSERDMTYQVRSGVLIIVVACSRAARRGRLINGNVFLADLKNKNDIPITALLFDIKRTVRGYESTTENSQVRIHRPRERKPLLTFTFT